MRAPGTCVASALPRNWRQLVALGQPGRAQRMPFRQQAAGRIGDDLAAIGIVAVFDKALGFAQRAQAEALVGEQFVLRKAIVQLADIDVVRADAGVFIDFFGRALGHLEAHQVDHRLALEAARGVGRHCLRQDLHLRREAVFVGEGARDQQGGGAATGRRACHQARQHAFPQHGRLHDVFLGEQLAQQRQRVVLRVAAGLGADLGEGFQLGAVALHVFLAGAAEVAQRQRQVRALRAQFVAQGVELGERVRPVVPDRAQRARLHLFEADRQHALGHAAGNRLARQVQRARAGRAVVVDVDDRNAGHAHFVEGPLAGGGVAVDVAGVGLLHVLVANACVRQGEPDGLGAHVEIRRARARFRERDHANPGHQNVLCHCVFSIKKR